jgi:hypothetical protein
MITEIIAAQGLEATEPSQDVGGGSSGVGVTASAAAADAPTAKTLEGMKPDDAVALAWGTLQALADSIGNAGVRDIFERFDTDGSGTLDKREFKAALATVGLPGASNKVLEIMMKAASQEEAAKGSKRALDYASFATALKPAAARLSAPAAAAAAAWAAAGVGESKAGEVEAPPTPFAPGSSNGASTETSSSGNVASVVASAAAARDSGRGPALAVGKLLADLFAAPPFAGPRAAAVSAPVPTPLMQAPWVGGAAEQALAQARLPTGGDSATRSAQAAWEAAAAEPALRPFAASLAAGVPAGTVGLAMTRAGRYNPAVRVI